jgi:hypothetical protein
MIRLSIELVPSSSWYNNVRSAVPSKQWDIIRKKVYKKADHKCEICGGVGSKWPVECHEVWNYDDESSTQTLVRMIALCPNCHKAKHLGRTLLTRDSERIIEHIMKVNDFSEDELMKFVEEAFALFEERSLKDWIVDISALEELTK